MRRKIIALYLFVVFILLIFLTSKTQMLPEYKVASYYVTNAYAETHAINTVTSIYLNYRYYDTLFEALMLLFSIIGVVYLSIHEGDDLDE